MPIAWSYETPKEAAQERAARRVREARRAMKARAVWDAMCAARQRVNEAR